MMHLLSVSRNQESSHVTLLMSHVSQKTTRKVYFVKAVKTIAQMNPRPADLFEQITTFYHDDRFIEKKKVFSQDRRPPKNVKAHPRVVFNSTYLEFDTVVLLQKQNIPVETITIQQPQDMHEASMGTNQSSSAVIHQGLGENHMVSEIDILTCALKVFKENRIDFNSSLPIVKDVEAQCLRLFNKELKQFTLNNTDEKMVAFFLSIWFRETIRFKKTYASSLKIPKTQI